MVQGSWKVWRHGIMLNEGGTPLNLTITWWPRPFFYVYLFGLRIYAKGKP